MKNTEMLISKGKMNTSVSLKKGKIVIKHRGGVLSSPGMFTLASKLKACINKYGKLNVVLYFNFVKTIFYDKATLILFETFIYNLLKEHNFRIELNVVPKVSKFIQGCCC